MVFKNIYHYACVDANGLFEHHWANADTIDSYGSGWRSCPPGYSVKYFRWARCPGAAAQPPRAQATPFQPVHDQPT